MFDVNWFLLSIKLIVPRSAVSGCARVSQAIPNGLFDSGISEGWGATPPFKAEPAQLPETLPLFRPAGMAEDSY